MNNIHDKFHQLIDEIDNTKLLEHFYYLMYNFQNEEQSGSFEIDTDFTELENYEIDSFDN